MNFFRNETLIEQVLILEADSHERSHLTVKGTLMKNKMSKKKRSYLQNYTLINIKILPSYHIHELPSIM